MHIRKSCFAYLATAAVFLSSLEIYLKYVGNVYSQSGTGKILPSTELGANNNGLLDFYAIGYTERQQLMTYLSSRDQVDRHTTSFQGHNVEFKALTWTVVNNLLLVTIRLHDTVISNTTKAFRGGNSFRTIYKGDQHRQACAYVDHSNDTYDVICKLYDACADVSIHVTYVAFDAYRWNGVFINKLIWSDRICYPMPKRVFQRYVGWSSYSGWNRQSRTQPLRWIHKYGKELPCDEQMQSCLDALPSPIEFIGDSQLRYVYNDLIARIDNNARNFSMGKLKTRFVHAKYTYSYVGFAVDHLTNPVLKRDSQGVIPLFKVYSTNNTNWTMFMNVQNVQAELALWQIRERKRSSNSSLTLELPTDQRRLIISFGTWDMMRINIKYFVYKALPMIRAFFESRRLDVILSKVKVIITTMPAVNEAKHMDPTHPNAHSDLRNNALLAAANRLLVEIAQSYDDVAVVDWFDVSVSRSLEATDSVHYLLRENQRSSLNTILNDVGLAMMRLLVEQVCA